jgi:hypothetical protein
MNELDTFLETPEGNEVETTEEAATVATPEAKPNAPEGKGEIDAAPPAAEGNESTAQTGAKHWSETAYLDEKRKRQELERRLQELEKPAQKQEQDEPDIFVDPKGFTDGLKNEIRQTVLQERINLSRELMLETKGDDYVQKEARFVEMVKADASLLTKMNASANPAKFAYDTATKAMEQEAKLKLVEEIGDPVAYREKLKAELLAELGQAQPAAAPAKPVIEKAPSLATASAAASNTSVPDDDLKSMFPR